LPQEDNKAFSVAYKHTFSLAVPSWSLQYIINTLRREQRTKIKYGKILPLNLYSQYIERITLVPQAILYVCIRMINQITALLLH
jgi:hypothetical protein